MQEVKTIRCGPLRPQFFYIQLFAFVLMAFLLWGFLNISHADSPEKDKAILAAQNYLISGTDDFTLKINNYQDIPTPDEIISLEVKNGEKTKILPEPEEGRSDYLSEILIKHLESHISQDNSGYTVTYHAECTLTPEERDAVVNEILPPLVQKIEGNSEREKAISAAKVVADTLKYEKEGNLKRASFEKAISENEGICRHYSVLYYLLLKEVGIESRTLTGYLRESDIGNTDKYHEWNAVKIDDKWYYADVTFSDDLFPVCGNRYLLKGKNNAMFKNRVPDEAYKDLEDKISEDDLKKKPLILKIKSMFR